MKRQSIAFVLAATVAAGVLGACSHDDDTTSLGDTGTLTVRLTDAPSLIDSIERVDVFVVRVDGRLAAASDAEVAANVDNGAAGGWVTLATPNASFNVLALRNGTTATLGDGSLPAGTYLAFRLVIDPSKTSVTLKNGRVLTRTSSPSIQFPQGTRTAIRVVPSKPVEIVGGRTTNLIVDFDVNASFAPRGVSIGRDGLLFNALTTATVVDPGFITATVRLVNLTRIPLTLWQHGDPLDDARLLPADSASRCFVVSTFDPLTVSELSSNFPLAQFPPTLVPGQTYLLVVFRDTADRVRLVTLPTRFSVATGRGGLRVFNGSEISGGLDIVVGAGAAGAVTFADLLDESTSAFVDVPPGLSRIRITRHGSAATLLDIPQQNVLAGERVTLVILPPVRGLEVPRFFIVPAC